MANRFPARPRARGTKRQSTWFFQTGVTVTLAAAGGNNPDVAECRGFGVATIHGDPYENDDDCLH